MKTISHNDLGARLKALKKRKLKKIRNLIHRQNIPFSYKIFFDRLLVSLLSFRGKRNTVKFYPDLSENIITASDKDNSIAFYESSRASRYFNGVSDVHEVLKDRYFPGGILLSQIRGATVVDVGANIGEFSLLCDSLGADKIIAFEPDLMAFKCLRINSDKMSAGISIFNDLLHEEEKEVLFFLSPKSADSSFIVPDQYDSFETRKAFRLDQYEKHFGSEPLLIKVEAEGGEPEVLRGAVDILKKRNNVYLTIRASCERQGESTMPECKKIIEDVGYEYVVAKDGKQLLAWRE